MISNQNVITIAEADAKPVGFAAGKKNGKIWTPENSLYFAFYFVMPQYRGRDAADGLSSSIIDYGKELGLKQVFSEPVTLAGKKHLAKNGFVLIRTEDYFEEKPKEIIKGKDGIDTCIYYVDELRLCVPDHIAIMEL